MINIWGYKTVIILNTKTGIVHIAHIHLRYDMVIITTDKPQIFRDLTHTEFFYNIEKGVFKELIHD